ncbi:MAG: hypothetical protein PHY48_03605 [Candidatus Cloacimonetes bacterium]|nr:hypothetical protein [Candidatus Cloacimonadota bacterium]
MSVLLDVLGSVIIGGMLILMMMTFQLQLHESAGRIYYMSSMIDHMDVAATKVNKTFALAGIGIPPDSVCVIAATNRVVFKTFWNCNSDTLSATRHLIEMKIATVTNPYGGKALLLTQDGAPMEDLGYIFYIEAMVIKYFDKNDAQTTQPGLVRSAEIFFTFRRDSPWNPTQPLRSNLQVKCFFMNSYLQGA